MNMCDVCFKGTSKNIDVNPYRVKFVHPTKRGESGTRNMHLCLKCKAGIERRVNVKAVV